MCERRRPAAWGARGSRSSRLVVDRGSTRELAMAGWAPWAAGGSSVVFGRRAVTFFSRAGGGCRPPTRCSLARRCRIAHKEHRTGLSSLSYTSPTHPTPSLLALSHPPTLSQDARRVRLPRLCAAARRPSRAHSHLVLPSLWRLVADFFTSSFPRPPARSPGRSPSPTSRTRSRTCSRLRARRPSSPAVAPASASPSRRRTPRPAPTSS